MTVLAYQTVIYPAREPLRVFPPVAEEDLWPNLPSREPAGPFRRCDRACSCGWVNVFSRGLDTSAAVSWPTSHPPPSRRRMKSMSRSPSGSYRLSLSTTALSRASLCSSEGNSCCRGGVASPIRTRITGTSRSNAVWIAMRSSSSGLSSRGCPARSTAVAHWGPIKTTITEYRPNAFRISLTVVVELQRRSPLVWTFASGIRSRIRSFSQRAQAPRRRLMAGSRRRSMAMTSRTRPCPHP